MFIPAPFSINDNRVITAFLKKNSFGQLFSVHEGRPFATALPFLYDPTSQRLACHLAKANPQWKSIESQEILITIQGEHDYISPTWYEKGGVPTWNYQLLQIYGKARVIIDEDTLANMVATLSEKYEFGRESSEYGKWNGEYNRKMLKAIVGLDIEITEIQCKFKLSQNKTPEDQRTIIEQLEQEGATALAAEMEKTLFNNAQ